MDWVFQVGNFLGGNFPAGIHQGGVWLVEIFQVAIYWLGVFRGKFTGGGNWLVRIFWVGIFRVGVFLIPLKIYSMTSSNIQYVNCLVLYLNALSWLSKIENYNSGHANQLYFVKTYLLFLYFSLIFLLFKSIYGLFIMVRDHRCFSSVIITAILN